MRIVLGTGLSFPTGDPRCTPAALGAEIADWLAKAGAIDAPAAVADAFVADPPAAAAGDAPDVTARDGHRVVIERGALPADGETLVDLTWERADAHDVRLQWTTTCSVLHGSQRIDLAFAERVSGSDFEIAPARYAVAAPPLLARLVARGARIGALPVGAVPIAYDENGVDTLVRLLDSRERRLPVVVVSLDPQRESPAVDPRALAANLAGLALVVRFTNKWASFALTDAVGKMASCYNGAVRLYWPGFRRDADPLEHPLWLAHAVAAQGSETFARRLLRLIATTAAARYVELEPIRRFRMRIARRRSELLRERADYDQVFAAWSAADDELRRLRDRVEELTAENANLKASLDAVWEYSPASRTAAQEPSADDTEPNDVLEAVERAAQRSPLLVFLDEAYRSARDSPYRHPARVLAALLAIRDVADAWAASLHGQRSRPHREAFLERGFEYKDDISPTAATRWGEEYTYTYRGDRILFAPHITIGAKSAETCLSIHMHWDAKNEVVVVAHVGRHKTNTLS